MKVMRFQENIKSDGNTPPKSESIAMLECEDNMITYLWWKAA